MEMVKFTNGTQNFWVKDEAKIKHWRKLALSNPNIKELKKVK